MRKIASCSVAVFVLAASSSALAASATSSGDTTTSSSQPTKTTSTSTTSTSSNATNGSPEAGVTAKSKPKSPNPSVSTPAQPVPQVLTQTTDFGATYGSAAPYNLMPYITVSTSPYIAQKTAFDASDIWSQQSSMNEDLFLLQYKQGFEHALEKANTSLSHRPIVEISGAIEGLATQTFNGFDTGASGSITLNTMELDINAMASKWATAFMSIQFDNAPPDTGSRVTNSRLYLSRGFAVIGNLDVTPIYMTVGQFYLPFGRYASYMLTAPVTLSMSRINDRALLVGYAKNGLFASIYAFPGIDSNNNNTVFTQGGANLGYKFPIGNNASFAIGGGYVSNFPDSQGMAGTGGNGPGDDEPAQFPGFANVGTGSTYPFEHNVGGADIHSEISYGQWMLVGEFISATNSFAEEDLSFNNSGAAPKSSHVELWKTFRVVNRDYMLGASYGHTWEALGLNLPENSFTGYVRTSFWKNTVEQLEFRHDIDYSSGDIATGASDFGDFQNFGSGDTRNILLAQVGVYF